MGLRSALGRAGAGVLGAAADLGAVGLGAEEAPGTGGGRHARGGVTGTAARGGAAVAGGAVARRHGRLARYGLTFCQEDAACPSPAPAAVASDAGSDGAATAPDGAR